MTSKCFRIIRQPYTVVSLHMSHQEKGENFISPCLFTLNFWMVYRLLSVKRKVKALAYEIHNKPKQLKKGIRVRLNSFILFPPLQSAWIEENFDCAETKLLTFTGNDDKVLLQQQSTQQLTLTHQNVSNCFAFMLRIVIVIFVSITLESSTRKQQSTKPHKTDWVGWGSQTEVACTMGIEYSNIWPSWLG